MGIGGIFILHSAGKKKAVTSHLHNGPEHGGSQKAPRCSLQLWRSERSLWSRIAPDVLECVRSARSQHTFHASFPGDPAKQQHYRN